MHILLVGKRLLLTSSPVLVVVTVKTSSLVLPRMEAVLPASLAGTARGATTSARPVFTAVAVRRGVLDAGITRPVTQKLGPVGGVTLDGPEPGECACLTEKQATDHKTCPESSSQTLPKIRYRTKT